MASALTLPALLFLAATSAPASPAADPDSLATLAGPSSSRFT